MGPPLLHSVWVVCSDDPRCSVLLAARGAAAAALEQHVCHPCGSDGTTSAKGACLGAPCALTVGDALSEQVRPCVPAGPDRYTDSCALCCVAGSLWAPLERRSAAPLATTDRWPQLRNTFPHRTPQGVPQGVQALSQLSGLSSFSQLPIGPASAPMGTLLLAKHAPGSFSSDK